MSETVAERTKCSTPTMMKIELCKKCGLKADMIKPDTKYETYHPKKTSSGWKCDMYENENQGNLF